MRNEFFHHRAKEEDTAEPENPMVPAVVESHPSAQNALGWGTRNLTWV